MNNIFKKKKRVSIFKDPEIIGAESTISDRAYNAIIGLVLLWGLGITAVICGLFSDKIVNYIADLTIKTDSPLPIIGFLVGYLVLTIVGNIISAKSNNPIVSFIGYNLVVIPTGIILSVIVSTYTSASIILALMITLICVAVMMLLSTLFPKFFLSIGKTLFIALLVTVVIELILALTGVLSTSGNKIIEGIVALIFCGYIGYDWARAQRCAKTPDNAVDVCVALYMDIINIFIRLLEIFGEEK